jgi:hypothetical protein
MRIALVVIGAVVLARAQVSPKAPLRPVTPRPATKPFGDDIQAVSIALTAGGGLAPKGQFETTSEYEQRLAALLKANDREYIFVKSYDDRDFTYDADSETMTITVRSLGQAIYDDADLPKL